MSVCRPAVGRCVEEQTGPCGWSRPEGAREEPPCKGASAVGIVVGLGVVVIAYKEDVPRLSLDLLAKPRLLTCPQVWVESHLSQEEHLSRSWALSSSETGP